MHRAILRNISRLMILVLLFTWSSIPPDLVFAAKALMPAKENLEQTAQKLERLFDALEEAVKEIPRDTFDPKAIVERAGTDPEKLFQWVRDNTYLVPYRGTLRGPIGVLMDRLGNSLDRALLLNELLTIAGHKAQLARGRLSKEQAEMVLNEARPIPPGGALPAEEESGESIDELITKYTEKYELNLVELQRVAQKLTLQQQHITEEVTQRVEEQTKAILELLGEPKIDIKAAERSKVIEALQNHWWVQWKDTSGWVELDSTLPEAKAGETLVEVKTTHQADNIDEELQHRVTIRVVIERWEDGKLEEEQVLEYMLRPSELFGKRIVLRHVPLNWPEDLDLFAEKKPLERLKAAVLQAKEWLPVLNVGSEQIVQSSFTDSGEVKDETGKKPASPAESLGKGVGLGFGGMLGAMSGGESEREDKKESHITAEWIDYEIHVPGEKVRKIRRPIVDLMGPTARRNADKLGIVADQEERFQRAMVLLFDKIDILPLICNLSPEFVLFSITKSLSDHRDFLRKIIMKYYGKAINKTITNSIGEGHFLHEQLYFFAVARHALQHSHFGYLNRPNLLSLVVHPHIQNSKDLKIQLAFDIVENEIGVISRNNQEHFAIQLKQGILDTNLEAFLLPRLTGSIVRNTSELFAISKTQNANWVILSTPNDLFVRQLMLPENVRILVEGDLTNRYLVVIPNRALIVQDGKTIGWWRIDRESGHTLGVMETGGGQALVEYVVKTSGIWLPLLCDKVLHWDQLVCHPCFLLFYSTLFTVFFMLKAVSAIGSLKKIKLFIKGIPTGIELGPLLMFIMYSIFWFIWTEPKGTKECIDPWFDKNVPGWRDYKMEP